MRTRFVFFSVPVIATVFLAICSLPLWAQDSGADFESALAARHPLITQAVDEAQVTTLKGNTHPLARPEFDLGTAPASLPMQRMLLVLKRSPEQETALRKLLDDQQDKASPNYHKWLTPEQFGKLFGPTDADIQTITAWLQSHGFQVSPTKGRTVMEFSGSASQVREAFHTAIHKYIVNGEQHWANSSDPKIPTALAGAVSGVKTLHNFLKKPYVHLAEPRIPAKYKAHSRPQFTDASSGLHALVPEDYATIYNAGPVQQGGIDGTGITIAVVARSNLFDDGSGTGSDVAEFRSVFGLPSGSVNIVLNGPDPGDVGGNDELEATLDASWSGALATGATIDFVVSASTNDADGVDLSEVYIIENNLSQVMTESFGLCEADVTSTEAQGISLLAEQAAAQGITYMVSTGDAGAAGCNSLDDTTAAGQPISVNVLASTPFTVAVGGTEFNELGGDAIYWNTTNDNALGSAKSYIPEDVWNETCTTQCQSGQPPLAAGSGGASDVAHGFFAKPSWQSGVHGIPSDGARDIPDVSLSAAGHDPYLLCIEASCVPDVNNNISFAGVEGTSASAPSFASIMALVDEKMSQTPLALPAVGNNSPRQGLANYVLYPLAVAQQTKGTACNASSATLPNSACVFNDVTVGYNSVPGEAGYPTGQYPATVGYDLASGLGSVNVANLVSAWASVSFPATTTNLKLNGGVVAITVAHGAQVNVGIGVTANSGTPAGDVSLIANVGSSGQTSIPVFNSSGTQVFTLSAGSLSASTQWLPGSPVVAGSPVPYNVTAHYEGITTSTGSFAPSDSNAVQVTVSAEGSKTALAGPFTLDQNNQWSIPVTAPQPFGTPIFVAADVQGTSGIGTPTGTVTFSAKSGTIPNGSSSSLNSVGEASIQSNTFALTGPNVAFDAGSYSISASYNGDSSFTASSSATPVTFTIQPGFYGVSGPTDVTIATPGASGTTTVGLITSTGFGKVTFTCSGLPAEAACNPASATGKGPNTVVNTTITVTTMGPHTTMLQPNQRPYYVAMVFGGGLPLAGIFLAAAPRRRRWGALLGLLVLGLLVALPACGGGGHSTPPPVQDPGTPAGTYTVTVTASASGVPSQTGTFTLTVQ